MTDRDRARLACKAFADHLRREGLASEAAAVESLIPAAKNDVPVSFWIGAGLAVAFAAGVVLGLLL